MLDSGKRYEHFEGLSNDAFDLISGVRFSVLYSFLPFICLDNSVNSSYAQVRRIGTEIVSFAAMLTSVTAARVSFLRSRLVG